MGEWKMLAQGQLGNSIQQCPAGHVHMDYGNLTLSFSTEEFLAFAVWVRKGAAALGHSPHSGFFDGQPHSGFSDN